MKFLRSQGDGFIVGNHTMLIQNDGLGIDEISIETGLNFPGLIVPEGKFKGMPLKPAIHIFFADNLTMKAYENDIVRMFLQIGFEVGKFFDTRGTEGGPEIDDNHLSKML